MTRKVANWFHEREGELFTENEHPFERAEVVSVINDSVDPVQQVQADGEKYVGVIDYTEHDGWYEYTRWDDTFGEVNIGVCAQCVKGAETVSDVSRTIGDDTDTAREKIEKHYDEDHDVRPNEVATGATLLSGTTISGNEAIHIGMDGAGSGVDSDYVNGNEALEESVYHPVSTESKGKVKNKQAPGGYPIGIDVDSVDCIWYGDHGNLSIYQTDQNFNTQTSFNAASSYVKGVGVDANDCIWHNDDGNASTFQYNQSGTIINQYSNNGYAKGISADSNNCLWIGNGLYDQIIKRDQSFNSVSTFNSPSGGARGVGVDKQDCVWHSDASANEKIYLLNGSGKVKDSFKAPSNEAYGVGVDSNGVIWHTDTSNSSVCVYEITSNDKIMFK